MKQTNLCYSYKNCKTAIENLKTEYPSTEFGVIGKSYWGRPIEYLKIGEGKNNLFFIGAHHGLEHLTSALLMRFANNYLFAIKSKGKIGSYNAVELSQKSSLYIVPMLNPDGVDLSIFGFECKDITNKDYLEKINPKKDFSNWQANARGVDLNHNYDAMWPVSKQCEEENNIKGPGATRFSGYAPFSEPETKAVKNFCETKNFSALFAFHSQGKVIYYDFCEKEPPYSYAIAKAFEDISPYKVEKPDGMASFGGCKDWFIEKFMRPGFTVEIGEGKNPLFLSELDKVYAETLPILTSSLNITI